MAVDELAAPGGPEKVNDGAQAGAVSMDTAPPTDQTMPPAGGGAEEGQGATDVPP